MAKRMSGEERRVQAAEAALKLAEDGLSAVTLTGVAEEMGVVPSALYRHFKSKDDLMLAVLARMREVVEENAKEAVSDATDPLDALRRLSRLQADSLYSRPGVMHLMFSEEVVGSSPEVRSGFDRTSGSFRERVRLLVEQGQREGVIRDDADATDLMFMFLGILLPPVFLNHISGGEFDFREQVQRNWRFFEQTVRARKED